ncbi:gustatory receptor for sugar taste 64b-like [Anopheles darlingi]|uniref:gustatory receptor for sugar taste 64b-like n=1 Tax=Anopheles darlingi TaxID=43151 RepID=UPI0021001744|nr:gustatory receptor for sugar taste 64b-like [Anopheles darlingi]
MSARTEVTPIKRLTTTERGGSTTSTAVVVLDGPGIIGHQQGPLNRTASRVMECSTHEALWPVICVGQIFSLMPIIRYTGPDPRDVTFRVRSVRFWYALLTLLLLLTFLAMLTIYTANGSGSFGMSAASAIVYYAIIVFFMLELMMLARNWSTIMSRWYEDELVFRSAPYLPPAGALPLNRKIPLIAFGIIALAFLEDTLNFVSVYQLNALHIRYCDHRDGFWKNFFHREHPYVLAAIHGYHPVVGWTIELTMRVGKFTWHYVDVFIICLAVCLQRRYVQYNERLERLGGQPQPTGVWRELRLHFVRLTELVRFLDGRFSRLILASCANNMFFITVQLFNSFDLKPTTTTTVYFWYSLVFLMGRCFLMLFIVSSVSVAASAPLESLRHFPSSNWNLDLKRLCDAAACSDNALSGQRFFFIRRPLILAMAGTIITYELVLLDQVKKVPDNTRDCTF